MSNVGYLELLIRFLVLSAVQGACPDITGQPEGYDISALDLDFITIHNKTALHINLCGNAASCQGNAACYTSGDRQLTLLGNVSSAEAQSDHVNVTLTGESVTTHVTLLCGNSMGRPEIQLLSDSHVVLVWETVAACRNSAVQNLVPCYSYNDQRQLVDLGDLVGKNYHIPIVDSSNSIYFSLCGPVTGEESCEGGGACFKSDSGSTNIGNVVRGPHVSTDKGGVVLSYLAKHQSQSCPEITTSLVLTCTPHQESAPILIYLNQTCSYNILWRTEHACPVKPIRDVGCKIQARGTNYDLTPLTKQDYQTTYGNHNYALRVCGNIDTGCSGNSASGCISDINSQKAWSMGSYHEGNLVWDDTGLTMIYNGGSQCSKGQVRSTKILFVCDKNVAFGTPVMTEQFYCFYSFVWRTKYACPTPQGNTCSKYGTDGELFDLSELSRSASPWKPERGDGVMRNEDLIMSVCGEMSACPAASLCKKEGEGDDASYKPLASLSEHFKINKDKSIELTYEGAGVCENTPTSLTVELTCKQGGVENSPLLISDDRCNYLAVWETAYACPSHSMVGTQCRIQDDVTGLTFDVTGLAAQPQTLPLPDGKNLTVQICGSLSESVCESAGVSAGVSACRSDGVVLGYSSYSGQSSSKLMFTDRQLAIGMNGADCENGEHYRTLIQFVCDADPEKRSVTAVPLHNCTYYILWTSPEACPMHPMECAVNNGTHGFDLSPLYDAGSLKWAGQVNGTQTALFVRPCGQVESGTEGCDHTAGVCAVVERGGVKVAMNLGRAASDLTIEDGVIVEIYKNGGRVCSDKNLRATTRVEYICNDHSHAQSVIQSAFFNDEMCMYIVMIASPYGCVQERETSHNCTITHPDTGITYDFSYLTEDYEFTNVNSNFKVHVCGPLKEGCGDDNKESAACEIVNGNYLSLGDSATSSLTLADNKFTLRYSGGDRCVDDRDGVQYKSTEITILCNRDKAVGTPRYLNKDSEACVYHFEWELAAACPPIQPACQVIDDSLREYDLSVLRRDTAWSVRDKDNKLYSLNVCGVSDKCGDNSAICSVDERSNTKVSLGRVSGEPSVLKNGTIQLTYYHGDKCGDQGRLWSTNIVFICEPGSESLPTITTNKESCLVTVEWRTLHACPAAFAVGQNCSVTNPVTGVTYDLWKLSNREYTATVKEHTYSYSFCTPLLAPCNGVTTAGSCQGSTVTNEKKDNGHVNKTLTYSNGVIILHYRDGATCSRGDIRETTIKMVCDHSLSDVEVEFDQIEETSHCVYEAFAFSGLPCDKEVLSKCEVAGYDISALALTRGNYYASHSNFTFTINACRGLNSPSPCSSNTAVCMRHGVGQGISLGEVSSAVLVYEDSSLKLKYRGADLCPETGNPYISIITFLCDAEDNVGSPEYLSNVSGIYNFLWRTKFACKDRERGESCTLRDSQSGETLLDLTSLKGTYSLNPPGSTNSYSVSVCEKLPNSECKKDTAVCLSTPGSHVSLGLFESDTSIKRSGARSTTTLTYQNGDVCVREQGGSVPYRTVIDFTCDQEEDESLSYIDTMDCEVRFKFPTPLVCRQDFTSCEVVKDNTVIDLSYLRHYPQHLVSNRIQVGGVIYLAVCQTLIHSYTNPCTTETAACLSLNSDIEAKSLGTVSGPLHLASDGNPELVYNNGDVCRSGDTYSTRITFYCDKGEGAYSSGPYLVGVSECEYQISWYTDRACTTPEPTPVHGCKIPDPDTQFLYDLTTLTRSQGYYQTTVSVKNVDIKITANICGGVDTCGADVAVCAQAQGKTVSLGKASTVTTELSQEKGEVEVMYTGGSSTSNCPKGKSSKILIMCCREEEDFNILSVSEDDCVYSFSLCSQTVCQFSPKECVFKLGGIVYDFAPLARREDNWVIKSDDRTFYMNPCRGVQVNSQMRGCSESSIACMSEKSVLGSESLGLIETRVQGTGANSSQIALSYTGGSDNVCSDRAAKTELLFTCGNSLGAPVFEGNKDCTYKFSWSSFVACNTSARPVISTSCKYLNPLTRVEVNLGKMSAHHYGVESSPYTVHFARCGGVLGDELEGKRCSGKKICVKDLRNNRVISFGDPQDGVEIFAKDNSAEQIIKSTSRCEDSSSKNWQAIVEYTCSEDAEETPQLRGMSHCHVLLSVSSPLVCASYKGRPRHMSYLLVIVLLCGFIFLGLILLYICTNNTRRDKVLRKMRSIIPVRGAKSQPVAYKRVIIDMKEQEEGNMACDF